MTVEFYERIWMWAAVGLLALFLATVVVTAASSAIHPPSHMETIDPAALANSPEFSNPSVNVHADGSVVVSVVAQMFSFSPNPIEVPANQPVTFRMTSADVDHGFEVVGTNANAMVLPGYVTQFTVTFPKAGTYTIGCNEYCGLLHHNMAGTLVVKEPGATE
jgi:cytochrome c oxidase subunit II